MATRGNKKGSEKVKGSGRVKGTPNKSTKIAADILEQIKYDEGSSTKVGYNPMEMQVKFAMSAYNTFLNLPAKEGSVYLKIAVSANNKIMDKIYGNIEIQKTEVALNADDIKKLIPDIVMVPDYKPINDPSSGLGDPDKEDDI